MIDSRMNIQYQRIQTARLGFVLTVSDWHKNSKKNSKKSYILTTIISDVILSLKACNLGKLLQIIEPSFLTGCYVFCLIVMAANGGNGGSRNGVCIKVLPLRLKYGR